MWSCPRDGSTVIVQRLVERISEEVPPDRALKLVTDANLSIELRRDAAAHIVRGVRAMQESDTYLAILDEGQAIHARKAIVLVGQEKCGSPPDEAKNRLENIRDLERLDRTLRRAITAANWDEILETP
jgi:hypothetical protein